MNDLEDYEGELDLEEAGWLEDAEDEEDLFDAEYEKIFSEDGDVDADVQEMTTSKRVASTRPAIAKLNQSRLSQRELDELFLEY